MTSKVSGFTLALCVAVAVVAVSGQQPVPLFRTGTNIVPLYVTVTDCNNRLVGNLVQGDFEIYDDDERQDIVLFRNDIVPFTVVVMLDTSASMTAKFDLLKASAEQFFIRMLPDDRGRVGAFNDKIQISAVFTGDRDELIGELRHLDYGNPTRLFDAIAVSLDELRGIEGRRVVLVFTDGDDTDSDTGSGQVLERARNEEAMIYAIGLRVEYFDGTRTVRSRPDRNLRKFADETGGGYFELRADDELGATFTRVAQELHSQYVLGFSPAELDGKVHELEVRVNNRGMTARARRSYVATEEGVSGIPD